MKKLDAVEIPLEGTNLIEASAGTGKTYTITTLALRLVVEKEMTIDSLLIVTFTRAATAELRDRIRGRLSQALEAVRSGDAGKDEVLGDLIDRWRGGVGLSNAERRLHDALAGFDEAAIFTIHGFCQRTLAQSAFESGVAFETELMPDSAEIIRELACDFWAELSHRADPLLVRHLRGSGAGPDGLVELVHLVTGQPDLVLKPTEADGDPGASALAFREAQRAVVEEWKGDRDGLVDLLLNSKAWNRNSCPKKSVQGTWIPFIDALETAEIAALPGWWSKLTPEGMKLNKNHERPEHAFFDACGRLAEAGAGLEDALEQKTLGILLDLKRRARDELLRRKRERGVLAFDDLLLLLRDALVGEGGTRLASAIRSTYRAALIDEFQDTDPVQYDIFRAIYAGHDAPLFMIGDPKQAIYAFRGADIFAYLEAVDRVGERRYTLGTNYRSDPSMVDAVNALFGGAERPFLFDRIHFAPVEAHQSPRLGGPLADEPALEVLFVPRALAGQGKSAKRINKGWGNDEVPRRIAAEIARLLDSVATIEEDDEFRAIRPSDIAVLSRTNTGGKSVQEALLDLGIPAVRQGDASVFEQPMAAELGRILAAMAEPTSRSSIRAALATRALGVSGHALHGLGPDSSEWDGWVERFHLWADTWQRAGFIQAFRRLMDDVGVAERLLSLAGGERSLTDLLHLAELAHAAAMRSHLGPVALISWLAVMREDGAERAEQVGDDAQIRLESDAHAVQLTTIHKSKGLEYPIVYVPFVWDGQLLRKKGRLFRSFHDPGADHAPTVDLGSPEAERSEEMARAEVRAENLRLLYVALTRARHRCSIVWGAFKEAENSAFGFLAHQPPCAAASEGLELRTSERILAATDEELSEDLERLHASSKGGIGARTIGDSTAAHRTDGLEVPRLEARRFERRLADAFRTSSFTQLAAGDGVRLSPRLADGLDHDATIVADVVAPIAPSHRGGERVPLADFPAGATPGVLMHDVFEHIDFRRPDPEELPLRVRESLGRYGLSPELESTLVEGLGRALTAPLGSEVEGLRLADLAPEARLNEMEFMFPISGEGLDAAGDALTSRRLAEVFMRHAAPAPDPSYGARVARLGFRPLTGFLKGFVDLIFVHEGRYFVVDYKSNHLGATVADYAPEALVASMHHHDYFLQYHLYSVALHRHLATRLPDYDYGEHFGGVFYLFVRGMSPEHPLGQGVFRDRPKRELIEELSALFAEPGGAGR